MVREVPKKTPIAEQLMPEMNLRKVLRTPRTSTFKMKLDETWKVVPQKFYEQSDSERHRFAYEFILFEQ